MSDVVSSTSAKSYLDFSGLGELRGKAQRKDDQALRRGACLAAAILAASPGGRPRPAKVQVDADEVRYQYQERKAVFQGKPLVKLTREDAVLTCRRLDTENDAPATAVGDDGSGREKDRTIDVIVRKIGHSDVSIVVSPIRRSDHHRGDEVQREHHRG